MGKKYQEEISLHGKAAAKGIALGDIALLDIKFKPVAADSIERSDIKKEKKKFLQARDQLKLELDKLEKEVDAKESLAIIDTQRQITLDPEIEIKVFDIIENKLLKADFAVYQSYSQYIELLQENGSELFRQRIIDLEDVRDRLRQIISGEDVHQIIKNGAILFASDLSPTELIHFFDQGISGIVMEKGGKTSHAAIIAQSLGIPCIVSVPKAVKTAGKYSQAIIDGDTGEVFLDPPSKQLRKYKKLLKEQRKSLRKKTGSLVSETKDGYPFRLFANIEFETELKKVKDYELPAIGLLRTECLLFGKIPRRKASDQVDFYRKILRGVPGKVTIRLFDIGGDKVDLRQEKESNPFLGWRGVRMLLDDIELLRNQLQAIFEVAGENPGRIHILVPMVSVIEEVKQIRNEIELVQSALLSAGKPIDENVPLGLMVEVPSVALSAYQFAREVDFFSMGTNDLTQYTMAVDRGNEHIASLFQHYHPSVLRLIKLAVEGAEKADIEVCACGELAGTEIGAACLFGLGVIELSMAPISVDKIKDLLTSKTKKDFEELAAKAIEASTSKEVEQLFNNWKEH